jgi:hypothetical protein
VETLYDTVVCTQVPLWNMESELILGRVSSKASVDSGVETGNDSNDSHSTFESHSTTHEFIPRNISSRFVISLPHSSVNNPDINTSIEQASGSVESKEHGNNEVSICENVIIGT